MRDITSGGDRFTQIVSGEVTDNMFLNMRIQEAADEEISNISLDDPAQMDSAAARLADFIKASVESLFPLTDGRAIRDVNVDEVREGLPARLVATALAEVDWNLMARGMIRDMARSRRMQSRSTGDELGGGLV